VTVSNKSMAPKFGQMVGATKVNRSTEWHVVKANSGTLMAIYTKASGKMIKLMAMAYTNTQTVPSTLVTGEMICSTDMAKRLGSMAHHLKGYIMKDKNTATVPTCGQITLSSLEVGKTIKFAAMAFTSGQTGVNTKAPGGTIICMVGELMSGLMDAITKANT
jgi:hypothetical protein